jgi:hypothetical protein
VSDGALAESCDPQITQKTQIRNQKTENRGQESRHAAV